MWPGTERDEAGGRTVTPERGRIYRELWEKQQLGIVFLGDVLTEEVVAFFEAVAEWRSTPRGASTATCTRRCSGSRRTRRCRAFPDTS